MKTKVFTLLFTVLTIFSFSGYSQNVAINVTGNPPDNSAMLDITATGKGMLIPRMAWASKPGTPVEGLLIYSTDGDGTNGEGFYYYDGGAWVQLFSGSQSNDWTLTGNAGTTAGTNFLGTTDYEDIVIKTYDTERLRINGENDGLIGFVGIGTNNPLQMLDVADDILVGGENDGGSEMIKIRGQSDTWTLGVQNEATVGETDFFIGLNDDIEDGIFHIQNNGNVGVNESTPMFKMEVESSSSGIHTYPLRLHNAIAASGTGAGIIFTNTSNQDATGNFSSAIVGERTASSQDLVFKPASTVGGSPTEKMRLTGAGNLGIGTQNPDDKLDVVGNAQISNYLRVGNPSSPQSINSSYITLLSLDAETSCLGWSVDGCGTCDNASNNWEYTISTSVSSGGYLIYDPDGQRSRKHLYTPWSWVPVGATSVYGFIHHQTTSSMESSWDGVSLEYSVDNGSTWTQVPSASFTQSGYNGTAWGSNTVCSGSNSPTLNAWNGVGAERQSEFTLTVTGGEWIRFRFVGTADVSTDGGGVYYLYSLATSCIQPAYGGGSFATGNIYAEKNVYAGSNVLIGDIAEYFPVEGVAEPGDLISLNPDKKDVYEVSNIPYNPYLIGVYSTNPTITINNQNSGKTVGLQGSITIKVTTENGNIKIGDYLTSSSTKGHGMKATRTCYVIGRALENYDSKKPGKILCLLEPGWYNTNAGSNPQSGGTFFIPAGKSNILVNDKTINENSRIIISMLVDPGSHFWINDKQEGFFEIKFSQEVKNNVEFDYFVENANVIEPYHPKETETKNNDKEKVENNTTFNNLFPDGFNEFDHENSEVKIIKLPENTQTKPPPYPIDPGKLYRFTPEKGVYEVDRDGNEIKTEIKNKGKEKIEDKIEE